MKKTAFQRCLRSLPTLRSAQRREVKIAIEHVDNKNLLEELHLAWGCPTYCPHWDHPYVRAWGAERPG